MSYYEDEYEKGSKWVMSSIKANRMLKNLDIDLGKKKNDSIWWKIDDDFTLPGKEILEKKFAGKPDIRAAYEFMIEKANRASRIIRIGIYKEFVSVTRKAKLNGHKMFVLAGKKHYPVDLACGIHLDIDKIVYEKERRVKNENAFSISLDGSWRTKILKVIEFKPGSPVFVIDTEYPSIISSLATERRMETPLFKDISLDESNDKFSNKIYNYVEIGNIYSNDFDIIDDRIKCKSFEYDVEGFEKIHDEMVKIIEYLSNI